jgi:hypothetical protein
VTSVVSDRLIRVAPDGSQEACARGTLGRPHMDRVVAIKLQNLSSPAFGGADPRSAYCGVLLCDRLPRLRLPVAGATMVHWEWC